MDALTVGCLLGNYSVWVDGRRSVLDGLTYGRSYSWILVGYLQCLGGRTEMCDGCTDVWTLLQLDTCWVLAVLEKVYK